MPAARAPIGRFVTLNCAALTESLLDNELFGHARGAFTGASVARPGLVEHASGGTLFLDEIGTMSSGLQAKLLRALEMGEVRRIGENATRRWMCGSSRRRTSISMRSVAAGEFRKDLYYRLNVHRVHMPPLRERPGDVPHARRAFPAPVRRRSGVTGCSDEAWALLEGYDYPGQRAAARARRAAGDCRSPAGPLLERDDFPEELMRRQAGGPAGGGERRGRARSAPSARWSPAPSFATTAKSAPPPGTSRSAAPPCGG